VTCRHKPAASTAVPWCESMVKGSAATIPKYRCISATCWRPRTVSNCWIPPLWR
tara:strand:- start:36878 stop:37039 length:162 start_codon:yes stop_codon:yes gene_type:complete